MEHRKFKIKYKKIFFFFFIIIILLLIFIYFINLKITNIYISGNYYFDDQKIIEMAKIQNYPRTFFNNKMSIKKRILSSNYIQNVDVKKVFFTQVYIDVVENRPLFYDEMKKKTVLKNGHEVTDVFNVPILTTDVSNSIYNEFLEKLSLIDLHVFDNISEISYVPNDVDKELFLFVMNDKNYVYVNLDRFSSINKYFDIVIKFNNRKGILYLDSGEYFKILDN